MTDYHGAKLTKVLIILIPKSKLFFMYMSPVYESMSSLQRSLLMMSMAHTQVGALTPLQTDTHLPLFDDTRLLHATYPIAKETGHLVTEAK